MRSKLSTVMEISDALGLPYWRINYVIRARRDIRDSMVKVGHVPAFDATGVRLIAAAIEQIDAKRRDRIPTPA